MLLTAIESTINVIAADRLFYYGLAGRSRESLLVEVAVVVLMVVVSVVTLNCC